VNDNENEKYPRSAMENVNKRQIFAKGLRRGTQRIEIEMAAN